MKKNSFVEGAMIATSAVIVTKILGMLYVIPFYKIIGVQGGALYSYAYNIYAIFLGISSAGIPTAISKIISEYNTLGMHEAKFRTFLIGKKIISYISIMAFLIMFIFADYMAIAILGNITGGNSLSDVTFVIRCVSFAILIIPHLSVTKGYIQGHSIVTPSSIGNIIEQTVRITIIIVGSFLAYKVFNFSLTGAIGIAVSGAFFGGLFAYFYLKRKMYKNKEVFGIKKYKKIDSVTNRDIIKKIFNYAFPFIIINIATSIYNFTDMVLILRGLNILGYSAQDAEFIQSAITTWSTKICMIVNAFAMGMGVSLIPNIVSSFVKEDWKNVNYKINKAYQIILSISIPCGVGLSVLSKPIWNVFYGISEYGPVILSVMVLSAIFSNLYSITFNTIQSLNKFKTVYISVIAGFGINALLDIPLILLFDKIELPPYWGATVATVIGYIISMLIAKYDLKKYHNISFKNTYLMTAKILIPTTIMILVLDIVNYFIRLDLTSTFNCLIIIIINTLIGGSTYIFVGYKMKIFQSIFGKVRINNLIKKLTFGKVSLTD